LPSGRHQQRRGRRHDFSGGNWRLDTADATFVTTAGKALTLVGAGSGNTFDAYGHINNASGTTMCPTAGTSITCVYQTGPGHTIWDGSNPAGFIRFGLDGVGLSVATNCVNETFTHIFFDGSTTSDGGDYRGILAIQSCAGPITLADIRVLTTTSISVETQLMVDLMFSSATACWESRCSTALTVAARRSSP
jgi:hypothetical protein